MNTPVHADLLLHAKWLLPIVPRGKVMENCSVAILGGEIIDICPSSEARKRYPNAVSQALPDHVLMPGLINTHGHAAMALFRGMADDMPLMQWLENHIWPAEQRWVDPLFVYEGTRLAIAEMLLSGTTCFSDMYFYPEEAARAAIEVGMRSQITFPIIDLPTMYAKDADDYLAKGLKLADQYRARDLITVGFGPHAPYTLSDAPLREIAILAEELQAPVQIHLHETPFEVAQALEHGGKRPIERMADLGLLSPLLQAVHMTQMDANDIALMATSGAHVIHCPTSNLKLNSGVCPAQALLDAGVNVALGTDGAASNNALDLFSEMHMAALIGKLSNHDAAALTALTALEMASLNAAKAMGIDDKVGSIEVGKRADLIAIDMSHIAQQPLYHVVNQLVYTHVGHHVSHVWVDGKAMVKNRELLCLDADEIKTGSAKWQQKLGKH